MSSQVEILESQIRECYGRVVYSHKTHEKCADILNVRHNTIKIIQIILSALTTTGILVFIFGDNKEIAILTAFISTSLFILNAYVKGRDLGEIAQKHSDSASDLWGVREKYLSLLTDIKADLVDVEKVVEIRDKLQEELKNIYKGSPRSIGRAYKRASEALKHNEELTFNNEEIDLFLPEELRRNSE